MALWNGAKAIETRYGGALFRSRLEARYAVFFDTLGLKWTYEPEGFDFDGERYLPDFWLPDADVWIEVKPVRPDDHEQRKAALLSKTTAKASFIFFGLPGDHYFDLENDGGFSYTIDDHGVISERDNFLWIICPFCHHADIVAFGHIALARCGCNTTINEMWFANLRAAETQGRPLCFGWYDYAMDVWKEPRVVHEGTDAPLLLKAYDAASSARFDKRRS